jgi:SAM-dependent methyltransferase
MRGPDSAAASASMNDSLSRPYAEEWEKNARLDPFFAILTSPEGRGGRWDPDRFFATGIGEVDLLFARLAQVGALPKRFDGFLDFGCGVGRLSQALAARFVNGIGIDISARMIELAKEYNRPALPIDFVRNVRDDLSIIGSGSISFVYSHIVLQHISNDLQRRFIAEFARILEPGGVAAFQIPVLDLAPPARPPRRRASSFIPRPIKQAMKRMLRIPVNADIVTMQMNLLAESEIATIIAAGECDLVKLDYSNSTEPDHKGRLEFFDRAEAIVRATARGCRSTLMSGFYFVRKD